MATYRGIIGTFNQSMGDLTFTTWKGIKVAKQKVPARNTSNTRAQQMQRNKFALLAQLAGLLGNAIRVGFKTSAVNQTEQNVFTSRNYKLVTLDSDLVPSIDFSKMVISAGNVEPVKLNDATLNKLTGAITIGWVDNSNGGSALSDDELTLTIVNSVSLATYSFSGAANRNDTGTTVVVPAMIGADPAQFDVYTFLKRSNSTATSNSTHEDLT